MSASEALDVLHQIVYGGVAVLALLEWRRHPGRASAWLAAAFSFLGIVVVASGLVPEDSTSPAAEWGGKVMIAVLVLFPYCLYRFLHSFVRPIAWIKATARVLTAGLVIGAFLLPSMSNEIDGRSVWTELFIIALLLQWVSLSALVAVRLWRAGRHQPTVARKRMRFMSLGAVGLALALVVAGGFSDGQAASVVVELLVVAAAPLMLLGFAPPHALRMWWRRTDDDALREASSSLMGATTTEEVARALLRYARTLVGGGGALLETEDGAVVASDNLSGSESEGADITGSADVSDAPTESRLSIPMHSHRLRLVGNPFTSFFGSEEIARLESVAALADLALSRNTLLENERRLASIVESSDDAILSKNLEGIITSWNRGAEKTYGYRAAEVVGKDISLLVPAGREDEVPVILDRVRKGESIDHYATRRRAKDGRIIDVSITISPLRDSTGTVIGASTIARDITDSKRLQEELRAATKAAEEANLAKSEFLSRMSHELRTPLNAILGFGQLLEMEPLTADQQESVEQMVKGGRHLLELIDEVLDLSRIETGSMRLSLEPVPVERVVHDATELIRPLANARGLRLRTELGEDMKDRHVMADQQRLGQVLLNLLSNAVKYNVEHGTVSITALNDGPGGVRIGVTDTGPGIPDEKIPLLFTPFERLGADEGQVEGTGLGLTVSKNLTEAMGGTLEVDTMSGSGTTFWVELKAAQAPSQATHEPRVPASEGSSNGGGTVLYIEDNLSNLTLVERLIARKTDVKLVPAMTGVLGIELASQHRPDLIFLDLHLPDLRGDEVLVRLRKDARTRDIPIVVVSADATPGQVKRLRHAGADDYLTKPIDVAAFMALVDRFLAAARGRTKSEVV